MKKKVLILGDNSNIIITSIKQSKAAIKEAGMCYCPCHTTSGRWHCFGPECCTTPYKRYEETDNG